MKETVKTLSREELYELVWTKPSKHIAKQLGISDDSRVVVYFGNDWLSPSTRGLLTLQYAGLGAHASLLDGGMPEWMAAD